MIAGTHLITGKKGNGKTLLAVSYIDAEVASGRVVAVCNINGLNIPGVIHLDDPARWRELPAGALLVVDEAQRYWRVRRSGEPPKELQELETARHDGVSHLFITQHPTFLDTHIRKLVDVHEHVVRRGNLPGSQVFKWERCAEDVDSATERSLADERVFVFPKRLYSAYKSAEVHITPKRISNKLWILLIGAPLAVGMIWWAVHKVRAATSHPADDAGEVVPASSSAAAGPSTGQVRGQVFASAADYARAFNPRIPTAPWTAPAFDGRAVVAEPTAVCMEAGPGLDANGEQQGDSCSCLTEQGTSYHLTDDQCRFVVKNGGVYNPYKRPERRIEKRQDTQRTRVASASDATETASPRGGGQPYGTGTEYGELGID